MKRTLFFATAAVGVTPLAQTDPKHLLLKDYERRSINKILVTKISGAKYPVIDMHSHPYAKTAAEVRLWVLRYELKMYQSTLHILETLDEHFYDDDAQYGYHWALNGFGLPHDVLKRIYRENALEILAKRSN